MANEVRLIDANSLDALEDLGYDYYPVCDGDAWYRAADVWKCIDEQPTIDPESLSPKGRWIMTVYTTTSKRRRVIANKKFACSECGYSNGRKRSNYCSNCGAKMEG